ncbi:MAG TPA: DUF5709 domain-containing protein [Actinomycetota bacterium]|nr:DUF5709 domain-containing protein [Actinomycetota bacterium]
MERDREDRSPEDEGIPDIGRPHPLQRETGDEGLLLPGDEPVAVDDPGTTAAEQREGESLEERLEEEAPDVEPGRRRPPGRLREEGWGLTDQEKDQIADEAEDDTDGATAEESAMRVEDDPGGLTDGSDSYVEDTPS